jgi:hypothetical protein
MLSKVSELTLENNPIEKDPSLKQMLQDKFPGLSALTLQRVQIANTCSNLP